MLDRSHRLTRSDDFGRCHRGERRGTRTLVLHLARPDERRSPEPRVGFTVGKGVGGSVVRNRVKRRLRHLMAARLDRLPEGTDLVVRALPASARASSVRLAADLDRALGHLVPRTAP